MPATVDAARPVPHCVMRVESMTVLVPGGQRLARLFERDGTRGERDVGVDAEIGGIDAHPRHTQRLDDLDRERTDACLAPVDRNAARREHRTLHAVVHDGERAVDDAAVRIHGHAGREVEVLGVAVEPEAVVVVRVAARGVRERQRRLVDRIVVERCQHGAGRYDARLVEAPSRSSAIIRRARPSTSRRTRAASRCTSVAPAATSSGTDSMLRGEIGPAVVARRDPQRRLHLERRRVAPGGGQRVADPARARGDAFDRFAHDRDPAVAVPHEPLQVARVQRARDPESARRRAARASARSRCRGTTASAMSNVAGVSRHSTRHAASVSSSSWPRWSKSTALPRRTPRAASRSRRRGRRDRPTSGRASRPASRASAAGRSGTMRMPVASRTRVVTAAIAVEHRERLEPRRVRRHRELAPHVVLGVRSHHDVVDDHDAVDARVVGGAAEIDETRLHSPGGNVRAEVGEPDGERRHAHRRRP